MKIFILEDDKWYGEILEYNLSLNPEYEVHRYQTAKDCLVNLHLKPDVITLDYSLPDLKGDEVLKKIKNTNPETEVVVVSGQEDVATAVDMFKQGVYDYLVKDEDTIKRLWNTLIKIREKKSLQNQLELLQEEVSKKYNFENTIIGNSGSIKKVFALMEKAAKTNINVSVTGETGTGKELVAKSIHFNSDRKKKNFVAVNMAAIPSELVESELFGYEKGAFTGALSRKIGKFEEANNGTIFLDEIAELDLNIQSKLLRVLQEREITRVGGNERISLNFRLISATHKNLADEVKKGNFREDLYYRIVGLPIFLPPLRDRGNDVIILANHFIKDFCTSNNMPQQKLSVDAQEKLLTSPIRGNIRELKSIIELACVLSEDNEINAEQIQFYAATKDEELLGKDMTLKEYTSKILRYYLEKYDNNVMTVAEKLDIGKSTVYNFLKEEKETKK